MKKIKIFSVLLCGAMMASFTACESHSGNNTPTFDLKVDVEPIDLGLPSGTLWAPYNVGATAPEEFGDFFAWGETEPKEMYYGNNYEHGGSKYPENSECDTIFKYCLDSEMGVVDKKTVLEPQDDAAKVNWGGEWRMPTYREMQELVDNCTWESTTINGINGYKVTGKNSNSIFLPAAGLFSATVHAEPNYLGIYLSSVLDGEWSGSSYALWAAYGEDGYVEVSGLDRSVGASVRPVCSKK